MEISSQNLKLFFLLINQIEQIHQSFFLPWSWQAIKLTCERKIKVIWSHRKSTKKSWFQFQETFLHSNLPSVLKRHWARNVRNVRLIFYCQHYNHRSLMSSDDLSMRYVVDSFFSSNWKKMHNANSRLVGMAKGSKFWESCKMKGDVIRRWFKE